MEIRKYKYSQELTDTAKIAKAISHPVRLYIIKKLSEMSCCYSGNIAEELQIGRSTLSQHLKELKHVGLIQGTIEGPYIKYCINKENWENAKYLFSELFDK